MATAKAKVGTKGVSRRKATTKTKSRTNGMLPSAELLYGQLVTLRDAAREMATAFDDERKLYNAIVNGFEVQDDNAIDSSASAAERIVPARERLTAARARLLEVLGPA